jgi:hypothetical protein
MEKKLKCWKKVYDKKDGVVYRMGEGKKKTFIQIIPSYKTKDTYFVEEVNPSIGRTLKITKTKSQAIKFVNSYMKKHDKC